MHIQAEANLAALIESTEDLIWSVDLDYRLITFNRALQQNIQNAYGVRIAAGMCFHEVLPPERKALWPQFYERVLAEGPFRVEYTRMDGGIMELAFNPMVVNGETTGISIFGKEITERKRAELLLRGSEERYRSTFDQAAAGIVHVTFDGKIQRGNQRFAAIIGYPAEEISGLYVQQITSPEDAAETAALIKRIASGGGDETIEKRYLRKDGSLFWAKTTVSIQLDSHGQPLHLIAFIEDINERKQAEERLAAVQETVQASEVRYRTIFETSADAVILTGVSDGKIIDANQAFFDSAGYERSEVIGRTTQELNIWVNDSDRLRFIDEMTRDSKCRDFEVLSRRKKGEIFWMRLSASVVDIGGIRCRLVFAQDITETKAAEERLVVATNALRSSEERYRTAFQTSLDAITISREDNGRYVEVNQAFLSMTGYEREEVIGRTSLELQIWSESQDRQKMAEVLRKESVCRDMEFQFAKKNGQRFWGLMSGARIEIDGVPSILFVVRDISEVKAAAEALHQSEERYHTVFQASPDAVIVARLSDGAILDVNRSFQDSTRFERDEVIGRSVVQLGLWENDFEKRIYFEQLSQQGNCQDVEVQSRRKNGELFWIRLSASLIDIGGERCRITFAKDISEVKAAGARIAAAQEALRLSEERYRTAFQTSIDTITISREDDGRYVDVNQAFCRIHGFERDEAIGRTSSELNIWVNSEDRQRMVNVLRENSFCRDMEFQFAKKNGQKFWGLMSGARIEIDGVSSILIVMRDISEAKAVVEALRLSEERYRTVFQTSLDAININRRDDGKYIDCNQAFLDTMGYEREEVLGRTSSELGIWANPRDRLAMMEMFSQNLCCSRVEVQVRKKNGELIWGEMSASAMEIDGVSCILFVTRDLSAAKAAEKTIRSLAFYDPLTGLPNRRMLMERLRHFVDASAQSGRSKAILLVDLDQFKTLNDTLGHQTGDRMLQEVARRIVACAHEADTVFRLGGDEFVVVLEDLSKTAEEAADHAKAVGEKVLDAIDQPCLLGDHECHSTASIGITVFADQQDSTDELLQQAEIALYQAKAAGRDSMRFFSPALQAAVNARAAMEEDLHQGIKEKRLLLYYQPQVERGRLTGVEALVRWKHPRHGIVEPNEFIPLAEESRLILPLGNWVLEAACEQIALWAGRKKTAHLSVAVNISALQFRQPSFVEQVLETLSRTGANPDSLRLELTESMLVENLEDIIAKMTELKSHGVRFSLDDFGTGYSSLTYLKRLPLDRLKIDRSFVRDMLVDATSGAIAQTILSLGRAMGISVIAEGVETEEQRGYLAGLDCHSFQGFLFSRPLPLEKFEAFLQGFAEHGGSR